MKRSFLFKVLTFTLCLLSSFFLLSSCDSHEEETEHEKYVLTEHFVFNLLEDNTYSVAMADSFNLPEELVFPSEYDGVPVTAIGTKHSKEVTSVKSVIIPDGVTTISDSAFRYCISLESITIPNSVTSIGVYAFILCTSLQTINIPESVSSISIDAFIRCDALMNINVDDNNEHYKSVDGVLFSKDGTTLLRYPQSKPGSSYVVPEGVLSIGEEAFLSCQNLVDVSLPNSLTTIKTVAFSSCISLISINIGDNVVTIGDKAFSSCYTLLSVKLGKSVKNIGEDAFRSCYKLIEVLNESSNVTVIKGSSGNGQIAANAKFVSNSKGEEAESYLTSDAEGYITYNENDDIVLIAYNGDDVHLEIPENITKIDDYAFYLNHHIKSVKISENVTHIGEEAFYGCSLLTEIVIPNKVTFIGDRAFLSCTALLSVTLGEELQELGYHSFDGCYKLVEVINKSKHLIIEEDNDSKSLLASHAEYIYNSGDEYTETVFTIDDNGFVTYQMGDEVVLVNYMGNEKNLVIPNNVTKIGKYALYDFNQLLSVTIPEDVTSIGEYAFQYCGNLRNINIPNSVNYIGTHAFYGCSSIESIVIPEGVTAIQEFTFYLCTELKEVIVSNGVIEIGKSAFQQCDELKAMILPNSVTIIGDRAFSNCRKLESLILSNSLTTIGESAFVNCFMLTSVTIPESVISISQGAFSGCSRLLEVVNHSTHITVEAGSKNNGSVGNYAKFVYNSNDEFEKSNLTIDKDGFVTYKDGDDVVLLAYYGDNNKLIIPDYVTKIGNYAFYRESNIIEVVINDNVTSIGEYSFANSSIISVHIGNKVELISSYAFDYAYELVEITIPKSVKVIAPNAFYDAYNLERMIFEDTNNWYRSENSSLTGSTLFDLTDSSKNAEYFTESHAYYYWYKK